MTSEISDFIDQLKHFGNRPKDETKVLAGIIRDADQAIMVLALMLREGNTERFKLFWIKSEGVYDRGIFEIDPSSAKMETFGGGKIKAALLGQNFDEVELHVRPIAGLLRETIINPSSAEMLVKAFKDRDIDLLFRLNRAGVPVFKKVLKDKKQVFEASEFPAPLDAIGRESI
jgi:hypothetical protein